MTSVTCAEHTLVLRNAAKVQLFVGDALGRVGCAVSTTIPRMYCIILYIHLNH